MSFKKGKVNRTEIIEALENIIKELRKGINRHLQGWKNYFKYGDPTVAVGHINWYVRERLRRHLEGRSQRGWKKPKEQTWEKHLEELGLKVL